MTDEPKCPVCNDSGKVTVQDAPFGKPFPASDREHVQTPVREMPCPMPADQQKGEK
jgi:hypothetical protein